MYDRFVIGPGASVGVDSTGRLVLVTPPGETVSVTTPAPVAVGGEVAGGAQLDPQAQTFQGYHEGAAQYDGGLALEGGSPVTVSPGSAIISTSPYEGVVTNKKNGLHSEIATLYVTDALPGRNAFGPAPVGWINRGKPVWRNADVHDLVTMLPSIDTAAIASGSPVSQAECMAMLSRENPLYPQQYGSNGMQHSGPNGWTGVGAENYGGTIADKQVDHLIRLLSDEATDDEKVDILRAYIRLGIDWGDPLDGHFSQIPGEVLGGNGHVASPGPVPIAIARWATGESRDFWQAGGNWHQYFKMTPALLAELGPHYSENAQSNVVDGVKPGFTRIRPAPSVNGDEIDVDVSAAYMPNGSFVVGDGQMYLVNFATGEKALVANVRNQSGEIPSLPSLTRVNTAGSTQTVILETGGGAKFSNGAEVYFEPTEMPQVGDYEFCIQAAFRSLMGGGWQNYTPGWNQPYQGKGWMGVHLAAINLIWGGTWHPVWEPLIGYFLRSEADARFRSNYRNDFDRDFVAAAFAHTPLVVPT